MTFLPFGDSAILLNLEQQIALDTHYQIQELVKKIKQANILGFQFCIPAYCSITIGFDIKKVNCEEMIVQLKNLVNQKKNDEKDSVATKEKIRTLNIPICYDANFALDLAEIQQQTQLSAYEIIEKHSETKYHVFMMGFLPGFPYLGVLPAALACKRKAIPRIKVPVNSIGLAGRQTGIYPSDAPGGWQIIGKTPLPIFRPDNENPFLFQAGDEVHFQQISIISFQNIEKDLLNKSFNWNEIYG